MTKTLVILMLAVVFVFAASAVWADHIDQGIAKQRAAIDTGTSSGKIDSFDSLKLHRDLDKIQRRMVKVRERGRYTPREIQKLEILLQRNNARIQQSMKP